jgi:surfactin synthase thioesterase subunit
LLCLPFAGGGTSLVKAWRTRGVPAAHGISGHAPITALRGAEDALGSAAQVVEWGTGDDADFE